MATTITATGGFINIESLVSDWIWTDTFTLAGSGLPIISIQFTPSSATSVCVISEGSISGVTIFHSVHASATDQKTKYYYGEKVSPVLDVSKGTYNTMDSLIIQIGNRHRP